MQIKLYKDLLKTIEEYDLDYEYFNFEIKEDSIFASRKTLLNNMKKLAEKKQILCITHLASIAVYADNQIKIEKAVSGGITSSNVHEVKGNERVAEIARMLSGDSDTQQSLMHAKSMLEKYSGGF